MLLREKTYSGRFLEKEKGDAEKFYGGVCPSYSTTIHCEIQNLF